MCLCVPSKGGLGFQARTTVLPWASKIEASTVEARQAFASLEIRVYEMRIGWKVLEEELVPYTEALGFLAEGKRQYKADTAPVGVGDSIVDAK